MNKLITIGASAGGVEALAAVVSALPRDLAAQVLIVMHVGSHPSILPKLLSAHSKLPVRHARDGEALGGGAILVAPSDHHMVVERESGDQHGRVRLSRGPKENHARPAIDVLFRSAAEQFGVRAVGVVLTGFLDDGTLGLHAIAQCGGITIVQDPDTAVAPSMPQSAIDMVRVDHILSLAQIGPRLAQLSESSATQAAASWPVPRWVSMENQHVRQLAEPAALEQLATVSKASCPDCGGTLFQLNDFPFPRYRCHTGHAFSLHTLLHQQEAVLEKALWTAARSLEEKEQVVEQLAYQAQAAGDEPASLRYRAQAAKARDQGRTVRGLVTQTGASGTE